MDTDTNIDTDNTDITDIDVDNNETNSNNNNDNITTTTTDNDNDNNNNNNIDNINNNNNNNNNISNEDEDDNKNDDPYDKLSKNIEKTAMELFNGKDNIKRRRPWFDLSKKSIIEKIKERDESFETYFKDKSNRNLSLLHDKRSELKKKKIGAKELWITTKIEEIETLMEADPRTAWKATKEIAGGLFGHHNKSVSMKMRKQNGEYCENDLENAEVFKEHYTKLYNNHTGTKYDENILDEIDTQPEDSSLGNIPTDKEIQRALSKMAYEKSPGPWRWDGIIIIISICTYT